MVLVPERGIFRRQNAWCALNVRLVVDRAVLVAQKVLLMLQKLLFEAIVCGV